MAEQRGRAALLLARSTRGLAAVMLIAVGCGHPAPLQPRSPVTPEIRTLDVGKITQAYLVMGERPILVDTGWGRSTRRLERQLARHGVQPRDLALIVLTHGHGDHAGGAKRMRELSGAEVLAHRGDVPMLADGHNRALHPMGALGRALRRASDKPFPAFAPDIVVEGEVDLRPYGVVGTVVPSPGHTPGSLVVVLPGGDAIVGDILRGKPLRHRAPARHLFHDDCATAERAIDALVQRGVKRFFVGHWGPIDAETARGALDPGTCPP